MLMTYKVFSTVASCVDDKCVVIEQRQMRHVAELIFISGKGRETTMHSF